MFYSKNISEFEENGRKITLVTLALPLLAESVLQQFYSTANTFLLKGYAQWAITATSVSSSLLTIVITIFTMVIKGAVILSSFSLGKKDSRGAARICGTAGIVVLCVSVIAGFVLTLWADKWITLMNLTGPVAVHAADYLRIRSIFLPVTALSSLLNNLLICYGYSKYALFAGMFGNVLNVLFCYIALYTNFPLPFSGVTAAAFCVVASTFFSFLLALFFFRRNHCLFKICFEPGTAGRILVIGIPSGMCTLSYTMAQAFTTGFAASLGETVVNAKVYISNIVLYTSRISLAMGSATGILVGRLRGKGCIDSIHQLFKQNLKICVLCNLVLSGFVFVCYRQLIGLFTEDAVIIGLALPVMLVDILIEASRGVNHVAENALNANGDVRATLIISVISTWTFSVFLAYILGIVCKLGLVGMWLGFAADEVLKASAYCLHWKRGKWRETTLLADSRKLV